jgi:hypothetical protein
MDGEDLAQFYMSRRMFLDGEGPGSENAMNGLSRTVVSQEVSTLPRGFLAIRYGRRVRSR